MPITTRSKLASTPRHDKNSEAKAFEAKPDKADRPVAKTKKEDRNQGGSAHQTDLKDSRWDSNKSAAQEDLSAATQTDGLDEENQTAENQAEENQAEEKHSSTPTMVQPADLWRKTCSKPHRI